MFEAFDALMPKASGHECATVLFVFAFTGRRPLVKRLRNIRRDDGRISKYQFSEGRATVLETVLTTSSAFGATPKARLVSESTLLHCQV